MKNAILDRSNEKTIEAAIRSWQKSKAYVSETRSIQCACGRRNVKKYHILYNAETQKILPKVGICCAKYFQYYSVIDVNQEYTSNIQSQEGTLQ